MQLRRLCIIIVEIPPSVHDDIENKTPHLSEPPGHLWLLQAAATITSAPKISISIFRTARDPMTLYKYRLNWVTSPCLDLVLGAAPNSSPIGHAVALPKAFVNVGDQTQLDSCSLVAKAIQLQGR